MLFYPEYRNRGLGSRLLHALERHARSLGAFRTLACATVVREDNDPRRPADYRPIDRFCLAHGFAKKPELTMQLKWREVDGDFRRV